VKCIKCAKSLEDAFEGSRQPLGGIELTSRGNYGSAALDGGATIAIYLCDECLLERARHGFVDQVHTPPVRRESVYEKWNPRSED
jgi:hypothetical protein